MAAERRRRLMRTAAREFADAGYERASLNRIIRACGMSKSSFYYYVDGKAALFDLVIAEAATAVGGLVDVPTPAKLGAAETDFWGEIAKLLEQLMLLDEQEEWSGDFGRLFHLTDAPTTAGSLARVLDRIHAWLGATLEAGRARGTIRDGLPAPLQLQLVLAVLKTMDDWSLSQRDLTTDERRDLVALELDALRRLLDPARAPRG